MLITSGLYTDLYQLRMAQVYFLNQQHTQQAVFDYFFRSNPFGGGYTVFAGLGSLLTLLKKWRFDSNDIAYLDSQGFNREFLNYLQNFRFTGDIYAALEGEIIFPGCPVVTVEASLLEAQLIETVLLNHLNFQSLIATKARRMRYVAKDARLMEFGMRRAQDTGALAATRAAIIGGFNATSNTFAACHLDVESTGTMAHAFVQSFDDELTAFRTFASIWPDKCVLLVDTYDTLKSGIPNAIIVAHELLQRNKRLLAVRLDSGDLAYLSSQVRKRLDKAGLSDVQIVVSNQLDEYVIKSLQEQHAPIDVFGVGTNLVVGKPDAALDGVYKLAFSEKPRMKLSENLSKSNLPCKKQVFRALDDDNCFLGADVITLFDEKGISTMHHPVESFKSFSWQGDSYALLHPVMRQGKLLAKEKNLNEIATWSESQFERLPMEYKRFGNPHLYKVGLSANLKTQRDAVVSQYRAKFE